jgi:hypothetical protein
LTIDGSHRANAGMERLLNAYVGVKVDYKRVDLSGLDNRLPAVPWSGRVN